MTAPAHPPRQRARTSSLFSRKLPFHNTLALTSHLLKVWAILISRNPTHLQCQYYQNNYFGQSKIICNLHEPGWLVQGCHWAEVHLFLNRMHTGNWELENYVIN